jgi:hypothetical protein
MAELRDYICIWIYLCISVYLLSYASICHHMQIGIFRCQLNQVRRLLTVHTRNERRDFLRCALVISGAVLSTGLTGCVPTAYTAWNIAGPGDPAGVARTLASLQHIFVALGYDKLDPTPGLLDSYWLPPSGNIMVRVKAGSDARHLLVILSEGGGKTFSPTGQRQVASVTEELSKAFGTDQVSQADL